MTILNNWLRSTCQTQLRWPGAVAAVACCLLAACGGGGGGGEVGNPLPVAPPVVQPPVTPPAIAAPTATQITLQSDPGDYIGQGRGYSYSLANANIEITLQAGRLSVVATGDEDWQGDFQIPSSSTPTAARYDAVPRYPQADSTRPAMRWFGGGRGCATSTGWFAIDHIAFAGSDLRSLVLRFERQCDGATVAMRGEVRWLAGDATRPPAVAQPAPTNLWRPPVGSIPTTGNYVYVQSEAGDYVGQGRSALYTSRNSSVVGSGSSDTFTILVTGEQAWYGGIQGRRDTLRLQPGYYAELTRSPFINPVRGGLSWVSDGRGCSDQRGWMVIDDIQYSTDNFSIAAITYRFEQRCINSSAVLRGAVRWSAADAAAPTTPSVSQPPAAWQPPATALPATGNVFYIDSEPGDGIERGVERRSTPVDAVITVEESAGLTVVGVNGLFGSRLQLRTEAAPSTLRTGVFTGLPNAFSPINDNLPHLSYTSKGSACATSQAWVAIDTATYAAGRLTALDLRFEQRCAGAAGATRGLLRWRADDLRPPTAPHPNIPRADWRPLTGAVPAAGSYLQINSHRYDIVGGGLNALYTQANARFEPQVQGNELTMRVLGDETWTAVFKGVEGQARLTPGTYAAVTRWPFHNPAKGGMTVSLFGSQVGYSLQGNFIIDQIEYGAAGQLSALKMRFEQHSEPTTPGALWGELRWLANDSTQPTGPVAPSPPGLWAPPAGVTPTGGSYLYFESSGGDFVGANQTRLVTAPSARFSASPGVPGTGGVTLLANTGSFFPWELRLSQMFNLAQLQTGYYEVPFAYPFQNPAKGGLSFGGDGRGCNQVGGWFSVDSISYSGGVVVAVKVRFEQTCEGEGSLRGEFVLAP